MADLTLTPCKICGEEVTTEFCSYCEIRVWQFTACNQNHSTMNIAWGAGKITWKDAGSLMTLIREHDIKEVLEFGTGLSTEILHLTGVKITSCDSHKKHIELFSLLEPLSGWSLRSDIHFPKVDFIYYAPNTLPDFAFLYPDKQWPLVIVDSPHQRDLETEAALHLSSNFIYLHDSGMSKYGETLPGFKWTHDRFWQKETA